ncbi:unnamed protein product [Rodentolepis nana]|uniref:CDC24_OB2 domain-containing protein n=1 Tax=Rodentolepis nana TaxID=102285 RepID=A0A0R3TFZ9_RODNA|nr:unnamed protein product [Rodentolepis nana]
MSLGRKSSILEIPMSRNLLETPVTLPSGEVVRRYTVSTGTQVGTLGTQVGTLLIPIKVYMTQVDVENLAVEIPLTEWKSTDLNVSAILASMGTKMTTILSDSSGIQVVDMKDLEEVGIQCGDEVYVAGVTASKPKYIGDSYETRSNLYIAAEKAGMRTTEPEGHNPSESKWRSKRNSLNFVVLGFSTSVTNGKCIGNSYSFRWAINFPTAMTAIINQSPTIICECGRQYTVGELERKLILTESDASGALGRVNSQFSTNNPLQNITTTFNTFSSQDLAAASRITSAYTGEGGRQFAFTEISNPSAISSQYSPSARAFEQSGIRCNCGLHLAAVCAGIPPVKISCISCARKNFEIVRELGKNQYSLVIVDDSMVVSACFPSKLHVPHVDLRVYESCHIICEAAIKSTMVPKRLTANIQPDEMGLVVRINTSRSFFTRGSEKRSSGSFESLRSHSLATRCAICRNEITSDDLFSSIRTSTSSLLGGRGVAAVRGSGIHEIADAYARICKEADQSDGVKANLYLMLRGNKIIQAIIDDSLKERKIEEVGYFAESKEILEVVSANEKALKKARNGD